MAAITKATFHLTLTMTPTLSFTSANTNEPIEIKEEGAYLNVYVQGTSEKIGGVQSALVNYVDTDQAVVS